MRRTKWKLYIFICVIVVMFILIFFSSGYIRRSSNNVVRSEADKQDIPIIYTSDISEEDCMICGNELNLYRGEDNVAIISMNSRFVAPIGINRYDDLGRLIEEDPSSISMNINNAGEGGLRTSVTVDSNRGYATADISLGEDRMLDVEVAAQYYCTSCLNKIMDEVYSDEPYAVGLINYKTGEVKLFDERLRGFMLGDFYVSCEPYAEGDDEEVSEIDLLIFYCPERYE